MSIKSNPFSLMAGAAKTVVTGFSKAVHEINEKYKKPSIKMTPLVSISLLLLRIYLLGMVLLMCYKFVSLAVFKK